MGCNSSTLPEAVMSTFFLVTTNATVLINGKAKPKRTQSEDLLDKKQTESFLDKTSGYEKIYIPYKSNAVTCEEFSSSNSSGYN